MRELKFRAWNTVRNCWTSRVELDGGWGKPMFIHGEIENDGGYQTDNTIIEQYTGLKDKNGKEIYEGDILGGIYERGYIAYCDKCKQFQYIDADMGCMRCLGEVCWLDMVGSEREGDLEVIGNIHENQDLLGDIIVSYKEEAPEPIEPTFVDLDERIKEKEEE